MAAQDEYVKGKWGGVLDWSTLPVSPDFGGGTDYVWGMHAVVLHTGKVMGVGIPNLPQKPPRPRVTPRAKLAQNLPTTKLTSNETGSKKKDFA